MEKRKQWEWRADRAREQMIARIARDPRLSQWRAGTGPRGRLCVYAARSLVVAEAYHETRMIRIIATRKAARVEDPPEPHLDAPFCPDCASPCGTTDVEGWLAHAESELSCGACGHRWQDEDDYRQAARADAAYEKYRDDVDQAAADAARLGPELLEVNKRMLEQLGARRAGWTPREQTSMFDGAPS